MMRKSYFRFISILFSMILCFVFLSGFTIPPHQDQNDFDQKAVLHKLYAQLNEKYIQDNPSNIYGGAYITNEDTLVICLVDQTNTSTETTKIQLMDLSKSIQSALADEAEVNVKLVKYSFAELNAICNSLFLCDDFNIAAIWTDQEANKIHIQFKDHDLSMNHSMEAQKTRVYQFARSIASVDSDIFVFEEYDPGFEIIATSSCSASMGSMIQ